MEKGKDETSPTRNKFRFKKPRRDPANFPWRVATIVLLFVTCGLIYFYNNLSTTGRGDIEAQQKTITRLQSEVRDLKIDLGRATDQLQILTKPEYERYTLEPENSGSDTYALIYWDKSTGAVFLDPLGLPQPGDGQQYQLWSSSRGAVTDLGTVLTGDIGFQEMKNAETAALFYLTLEPAGGREEPSLHNIVVSSK